MKFLIEITEKLSRKPDSNECSIFAFLIANKAVHVFRSMTAIELRRLDLNFVFVNNPNISKNVIVKIKKAFEVYNIDRNEIGADYRKLALENNDKFLSKYKVDEIKSDIKYEINRIIKSSEFFNSGHNFPENKEYLCYLPYIENILDKIIDYKNLTLIEDFNHSIIWGNKQLYKIKSKEYSQFRRSIEILSRNKEELSEEYYCEKHNHRYGEFLSHIGDDFYNELLSISDKNRGQLKTYFHGKDFYVAQRAIDSYLSIVAAGIETYNHDFIDGFGEFTADHKSYVLFNLHILNVPHLNFLHGKLLPIENSKASVVLQGFKKNIKKYLGEYYEFAIPTQIKYKQKLSELFIDLLIENEKMSRDGVEDLYPIIMNNGFENLLSKVEEMEILNKATSKIKNESITADILLNRITFWIRLDKEIESALLENEIEKQELKEMEKYYNKLNPFDVWKFEFSGNVWTISNKDIVVEIKENYVTFLVMVIRYNNYFNEAIPYKELSRSVLKFYNNPYGPNDAKSKNLWPNRKGEIKKRMLKEFSISIDHWIKSPSENIQLEEDLNKVFEISTTTKHGKIKEEFFNDIRKVKTKK